LSRVSTVHAVLLIAFATPPFSRWFRQLSYPAPAKTSYFPGNLCFAEVPFGGASAWSTATLATPFFFNAKISAFFPLLPPRAANSSSDARFFIFVPTLSPRFHCPCRLFVSVFWGLFAYVPPTDQVPPPYLRPFQTHFPDASPSFPGRLWPQGDTL